LYHRYLNFFAYFTSATFPPTKRFLKNLFGKFEERKVKLEASGCTSINPYFQDESRFGLLPVLRDVGVATSEAQLNFI